MEFDAIFKEDEHVFSAIQAGNEPTSLNTLQSFLAPHVERIEILLWVLWVCVLIYVIRRLISLPPSSNSSADNQ